jgi:DNA-binding MarR family transcriptional regulator
VPDQLPQALDPMEEAAWRDLARFFRIAPRLLDEDLQRGADISLTEYTTLMSLSEAPGRRLRMTELSNHVYLSGSRTTRLVNELAASGLIRKTRSTTDARGIDVSLTATGLARLQAAYPVHLASVRDRVLSHVDRDALPFFGEVMAAIARALG